MAHVRHLVDEALSELRGRLGPLGKVVVAGGAIRDMLRDQTPRDLDVFVLIGEDDEGALWEAREIARSCMVGPPQILGAKGLGSAASLLRGTLYVGAYEVRTAITAPDPIRTEVMVTTLPDMQALIDSFDWNVSQFAFDGETLVQAMPIHAIAPGNPLVLNDDRIPFSTLRRGFKFSERFGMKLDDEDAYHLCRLVAKQHPVPEVPVA